MEERRKPPLALVKGARGEGHELALQPPSCLRVQWAPLRLWFSGPESSPSCGDDGERLGLLSGGRGGVDLDDGLQRGDRCLSP